MNQLYNWKELAQIIDFQKDYYFKGKKLLLMVYWKVNYPEAMASFNNVKFMDSINEKMPNITVPNSNFKVKKPG